MTTKPKLTLARWAALDQAVETAYAAYTATALDRKNDFNAVYEKWMTYDAELDDFNNTSRQAPTRLLAALRGLADRWWVSSNDINHNSDSKRERIRAYAFREASAQLRALIEQTDLSGDVK